MRTPDTLEVQEPVALFHRLPHRDGLMTLLDVETGLSVTRSVYRQKQVSGRLPQLLVPSHNSLSISDTLPGRNRACELEGVRLVSCAHYIRNADFSEAIAVSDENEKYVIETAPREALSELPVSQPGSAQRTVNGFRLVIGMSSLVVSAGIRSDIGR